jgi:Na+/glutamate symporter
MKGYGDLIRLYAKWIRILGWQKGVIPSYICWEFMVGIIVRNLVKAQTGVRKSSPQKLDFERSK